jgi:hypothetical protein
VLDVGAGAGAMMLRNLDTTLDYSLLTFDFLDDFFDEGGCQKT